ncbi:hypothetical protein RKD55_003395 [Rossellomorea marisflavi]
MSEARGRFRWVKTVKRASGKTSVRKKGTVPIG